MDKRKRSPSRSPSRSPPRQRKRPGAASRLTQADREAAKQRQIAREQEQEKAALEANKSRGVHDVVKQHYNLVPERGRDWRNTASKITGLRSYNNWVKSCTIQKFIGPERGLNVLDIGCGKGGDLGKWSSSRKVALYVGCDPADVSITQAQERYDKMKRKPFRAEFYAKDCFGETLADIEIIRNVGFETNAGPGGNATAQRWGRGGFDIVSMMFCMHYAFESEEKARGMLRNVAGALKKGGRFLGTIPNSDVLSAKVTEHHKGAPNEEQANGSPNFDSDDDWDPEKIIDAPAPKESKEEKEEGQEDGELEDEGFEWGNSIYRVKFPGKTPTDGVFRPPFGWKYFYFLEEAVEEVPEYVVPWEAFRALAEEYNLELQYRAAFKDVWEQERNDPELGPLSERMNVRDRTGRMMVREEELDAASFYHTFCFYKV
ncbi:guanine-N(7)-methyltransferase [Lophium mytilinum]|uniref:mRNA cap guanine-N(7) methyltransferase n=1 Tax=Lophium mytilinum TaxID=390894 RepID=A0A6A6QRB6_9PEZI|nr:guanine-N(7)-methyltransferase [Lophium mytilinum]